MGLAGIVNTLAHLRLMEASLANEVSIGNDYKALIVLFLFGGQNSDNLLAPRGSHPSRANYDASRGILALADASLHPIDAGNLSAPDNSFGLNPACTDLKTIFDAGELAFVANVGSLTHPITKAEYNAGSVPVPPQLFSHSDQQTQWQSSIPDKPFQTGWAGRIADLLNASYNPQSQVSMSVTLGGQSNLLIGNPGGGATQYAVTNSGAIALSGYGTNYSSALNPDGTYQNNTQGRRLEAFEKIMNFTHEHLMEEGYNNIVSRARQNEEFVGGALAEASTSGVDFDGIFANADSDLGDQLKMVAQLIAGRSCVGNSRQIFFVTQGGYDTHQDQGNTTLGENGDFYDLLSDLNGAMKAFNDAMHALDAADADFSYNDTVLATHSDFNRTFTPNGEDPATSGSDHAWGGHMMVMGGAVNGGNVYGYYPDHEVNGPQDVSVSNGRGRWIPTTSVDQYASVLGRWMDVSSNDIPLIFPNLSRFADPFSPGYDPLDQLGNANTDFINFSA
ncbi:MAG: DUF1501 domain-containing protein [Verrucomicrobiota bacterium]